MKRLQDALIDYDLSLLQALAAKRGLPRPQNRQSDTLTRFVSDLLSPSSLAITLDDLSEEERQGFEALVSQGGLMEYPKFVRLYGSIRGQGRGKLLREQPWENPANVAEGLWYRGLVFKDFRHTVEGPEEVIFIPDDLLDALPDLTAAPPTPPTFEMPFATLPIATQVSTWAVRENLFILLVYLHTHIVRAVDANTWPSHHQQALQDHFSPHPQQSPETIFQFIFHLAERLDFLQREGPRLRLNIIQVKAWLQASAEQQIQTLQNCWRGDPYWSDLAQVPGLVLKPTGWDYSPLLARSQILAYLSQLPAEEWLTIEDFKQTLKKVDPDFQRPHGDYQSWYIYDPQGQPLMGFEHWDAIEGGLIQQIIVGPLFGLGVVDLGGPAEDLPPTHFLMTPLGYQFLNPQEVSIRPPAQASKRSFIRINATNFTIRVSNLVSLYDRFQLARLAELVRREPKQVVYQITRSSYRQALEQSITLEQILAFLNRITRAQVPLNLSDSLHHWDRQIGSVKLEHLTLIRFNQIALLSELLQHPEIGPLLDIPLGDEAILVPEKNVTQVRQLLLQYGYLEA